MSSFFRLSSNPDHLSLSYNRDSAKVEPFTAHNKKVLCECFTEADDFGDYRKLSRFLHLERHELYPAMIKTNSAIDDCISFIKQYRTEGYWKFLCIVEYCVSKNDVHGNHYIIGCKQNDQLRSQMEKLRERKELKFTASYPCIVLKNFTDAKHSFLEDIFPNIIGVFIYDAVVLGKLVAAPSHRLSDQKFDRQMHSLRALDMAKDLLQIVRQRLQLPEKYQLTIEQNVNVCMADVCTMLTTCLSILHSDKPPSVLEIKNTMLKLNENLIIFVSNYYFYLQSVYDGGSEIVNHDRICLFLHNGYNFICKNLRYQTINSVFCEYYDYNEYYTTPVIQVTDTNFELLLSVFKTQGYTTLKFRKVLQTDEDDDWLLETTESTTITKVNFTRFEVSNCLPDNDETTLNCYVKCCVNEPGNCLWICINCETLVMFNKHVQVMCHCGIKADSANPTCLKCVANNRSFEIKTISHDVELQNYVYNDEQVTVMMPIITQEKEALIRNTVRRLSAPPDLAPLSPASDMNVNQHISFYEPLSTSASDQSRNSQATSDGITESSANECEHAAKIDHNTTEYSEVKPSNYNVLILGSSAVNKQLMLNTLYCVQVNATFDDAVQNAETIAFQDSDDYVIDYGTHTIRYINDRYINKHELSTESFDIDGIMIVVENNMLPMSITTDNRIRETFSRLPKWATKNCCVVNTFSPTETFHLKTANQQMSEWMKIFCSQHELTNPPYFICLDKVKMQAIIHHNFNTTNVDVHRSFYESCKRRINRFLKDIQSAPPVTPNDLQIADSWKHLCDVFCPYVRGRDPETLRLKATIAENALTGFAIYCRRNKGDAQPLRDDEWPTAVAYWNTKDEKVGTAMLFE